ncbi:MAG: error-prone DNA polymerase, partial [Gemmatimonadota bacterium]
KRTLGVPLFQEQGMKVAVILAGFTPAQADTLRRAMGFKRSQPYMEEVGRDLARGLRENGVSEEVAAQLFNYLTAFANYGFPESHAASFALLVYASAYLKRHYAPEFYAALLNAQPMGFYAPSTIVHDARRHGVEVRPVDLARSEWDCTLESREEGRGAIPLRSPRALESEPPRRFAAAGSPPRRAKARCGERPSLAENGVAGAPDVGATNSGIPAARGACPEPALRLGLRLVHGLGPKAREKLQRAREAGPFTSVEDAVRRSGLGAAELRVLAEAGAFESLWPGRREALWELLRRVRGDAGPLAPSAPAPVVGAASSGRRAARAHGVARAERGASLPPMSRVERIAADYRCLGLSVEGHPMEPLRKALRARGVLSAAELAARRAGERVAVAGLAICRQRPGTAKGVMFVTLEDETGFANFVVMPDVQERYRREILGSPLLLLEGIVEREGEVVTVRTGHAAPLGARRMPIERRVSRDFR